eukprot:scaffold113796_cov72-Phaeocystis_antarctica.AAC.1
MVGSSALSATDRVVTSSARALLRQSCASPKFRASDRFGPAREVAEPPSTASGVEIEGQRGPPAGEANCRPRRREKSCLTRAAAAARVSATARRARSICRGRHRVREGLIDNVQRISSCGKNKGHPWRDLVCG